MHYHTLLQQIHLKMGHTFATKPSVLEAHLTEIEDLIQRPFPQELVDFYRYTDGVEITFAPSQDTAHFVGQEFIPTLAYMFDDFRAVSAADAPLDDEEAFYEKIWYDFSFEGLSSEQRQFIKRQKLLIAMNASSSNITIDFYDPSKPYQLYYQPNGEAVFYPLNISIADFYYNYLHIGQLEYWFHVAMSKEDKYAACLQSFSLSSIQKIYPHFDWKEIKYYQS